ncbi:MAG: class I SAM-dependent methyltransferase [Treponema sp.]|nr:class I SAM-dependent methyltransferase [Treponema sp.]MBQ7882692.1 class I SAM-dependent methyltransferase [Treponema sp.]
MENKNQYQAELFSNRLTKKYKSLKKWARKERISCYRLYDKDIPEIPLAADLYEFLPNEINEKIEAMKFLRDFESQLSQNNQSVILDSKNRTFLHLYLYERPYEKSEEEESIWLQAMAKAAANVLQIPENHVITKLRKKQKGLNQYEKIESNHTIEGLTQECGQLFKLNLSDYLDTGLFLDHRPLRNHVRTSVSGKSVLNLFCYTGSFSVYAAEGKASRVESVDLSNTYISWAKENMLLNGFSDKNKYFYTRQDVIGFLNQKNAEVPNQEGSNRFDVIILDPPTFSNSKATSNTLDINRDWKNLVCKCINILKPNGILYFSTNSKRLVFEENELSKLIANDKKITVSDISDFSIPEDFKGSKIHRCWKIQVV